MLMCGVPGIRGRRRRTCTQEFFARLLAHNTVARADPARGRFRSFLLASLKHFLAHEWEKARAQKRGGGAQFIPLEFDTAETRCAQPVAPGDTPDRAFDRQWALALLDVVLGRLRGEYRDAGREDLFLGLKDTLSGGRAEIPVSRAWGAAGVERRGGEGGGAPVAAAVPRIAARGDRQHGGRAGGGRGGIAGTVCALSA